MGETALTNNRESEWILKEIIFLGTGTSSGVPTVKCLVQNPPICKVCPTVLTDSNSKNRRRNTSLLIRIVRKKAPNDVRNIIIDVGKTFYDGSIKWFVEHGITKIDAVILSHGHADAILGLDDLRPWTIAGYNRYHRIPIFLHRDTFKTVSEMFPYIVATEKATGGGDVPQLQFEIFDDDVTMINVAGLEVIPLKVQHGQFSNGEPYYCNGFRFGNISYLSDVSYIPESAWESIRGSELIIMDALRSSPHISHFSIPEALHQLVLFDPKPRLSLLVGFTHQLDHDELVKVCKSFERTGKVIIHGQEIQLDDEIVQPVDTTGMKILPAYDGMKVELPLTLTNFE
ncbi:beta-lactamase-like protein [Paraphysoderma sedebokerense]|nr:beta-lactamase-like protein [Paraphysoderma sedebokerense]